MPDALWKGMGQLSTTELCVVQVARARCVKYHICNIKFMAKTQALLEQLLGVTISRSAIAAIRKRLSAALEQPTTAAHRALQQQPVVYVDETGAPTGNAVLAIASRLTTTCPASSASSAGPI
jgi:glucose-6-phosphate-specific signal transduction histidine kinase